MGGCCVVSCGHQPNSCSSFCLPPVTRPAQREAWLKATQRDLKGLTLKTISGFRVCSCHFSEDQLVEKTRPKLFNPNKPYYKLKESKRAVPSVSLGHKLPVPRSTLRPSPNSKKRRRSLQVHPTPLDSNKTKKNKRSSFSVVSIDSLLEEKEPVVEKQTHCPFCSQKFVEENNSQSESVIVPNLSSAIFCFLCQQPLPSDAKGYGQLAQHVDAADIYGAAAVRKARLRYVLLYIFTMYIYILALILHNFYRSCRILSIVRRVDCMTDEDVATSAAMLLRELGDRQPQFSRSNNIMASMVEQQTLPTNKRRYNDPDLQSFSMDEFGRSKRHYSHLRDTTFPVLPHPRCDILHVRTQ